MNTSYATDLLLAISPKVWISSYANIDGYAIGDSMPSVSNYGEQFYPSGTGVTISQGTTSNQPIFEGRSVGFDFAGDDFWEFGSVSDFTFLSEVGGTLLFVITPEDIGNDVLSFWFGSTLGSSTKGVSFFYENRSSEGSPDYMRLFYSDGAGTGADDVETTAGTLSNGQRTVIAASYDGTSYAVSQDGETIANGSWSLALPSGDPDNPSRLGLDPAASGSNFDGSMHTFAASESILTESELNALTSEVARVAGTSRIKLSNTSYPTKTTIDLKPELYLDVKGDTTVPDLGDGVETPENRGNMFYPGGTGISPTQATASNQPIWRGRSSGWEFAGDDYWDLENSGSPLLPVTDDFYIAAVLAFNSTADQTVLAQYLSQVGNGRVLIRARSGSLEVFLGDDDTSGAPTSLLIGGSVDTSNPTLLVVRRNGRTFELRENGSVTDSVTDTVDRELLQTGNTIGVRSGSSSDYTANLNDFLVSDLHEFQVGYEHTTQQVGDLENELMNKWGIS